MKINFAAYLILISSILLVTSCSIEKRVHRDGFHVAWKKNLKSKDSKVKDITFDGISKQAQKEGFKNLDVKLGQSMLEASPGHTEQGEEDFSKSAISVKRTNKKTRKVVINDLREEPSTDKALNQLDSKKSSSPKEKRSSAADGGGKSQVIALILVIFVGILGVHRFYLGYTGIGVLMILTLGCCGILALIDLIRIATGDLKPKNGDYSEKL